MKTKFILTILSILIIFSIFGCSNQKDDITGAVPLSTIKESQFWDTLNDTTSTNFIIKNEGFGIREIKINVLTQTEYSGMDILKLPRKPPTTPQITDIAFEYYQIVTSNILNTNTKDSKFIYQVNKEWILKNKIDSNSIKLLYYRDDKWNVWESTKTGSENNVIIEYESEIDRFDDYYIIAGTPEEEIILTPVYPVIEEPSKESILSIITGALIIVVTIAGLLGYFISKDKK